MLSSSDIERRAAKLLKGRGLVKPPICLRHVCDELRVRVQEEDLDEHVSGLLVIKDGRGAIAVNRRHPESRRRFTIAHELGHYVLHAKESDLFLDYGLVFFRRAKPGQVRSSAELEANRFAAALLMPKSVIRPICDAHTDSGVSLPELAREFRVSEQAMAIRLAQLNLIYV